MRSYIMLILLLSSCGNSSTDWEVSTWIDRDPPEQIRREAPVDSLAEIVDDFLYDCGEVYGADVSSIDKLEFIRYGKASDEENPTRVGVCYTFKTDDKVVKTNILVNHYSPGWFLKGLVYHELGHCILGLDHAPQYPFTLMSPAMNQASYYEENWDELVEQMCTSQKR